MSEKTKPNAPAAEAQKPSSPAESQPQTPSQASSGNMPSILDIAKDISDEKVKIAEDLGVPITAILRWAYGMESTMKAIVDNLPGIVQKNTIAAIETYKAKVQAMPEATQPGGSGGLSGQVMQIAKELMGSGGSGQPDATTLWLAEIGKEQMAMSRILYQEFVKRMVPDIAEKMQAEAAKIAPKTS
jgi:hypothetical protein